MNYGMRFVTLYRRQGSRPSPRKRNSKKAKWLSEEALQIAVKRRKVKVKLLSHVWLLATPWTAAHQAPPSMGFYRQEYWSGLPLPSPALITEEDFLCLLALLWNSAFKLVYLSFSPLLFTSLLFTAICKASSDSHFAFLRFFFLRMILIPASCTMSQISVLYCAWNVLLVSLIFLKSSLVFPILFVSSISLHWSLKAFLALNICEVI